MSAHARALHQFQRMLPLRKAGYTLMPLTSRCTPRDKGWPELDYGDFNCITWLTRGGAIGVRLGPDDLIIDVDRHEGQANGAVSLDNLCIELGVDLAGPDVPKVISGGGGLHLFFKKPSGLRTSLHLGEYPSIDFKCRVGMVVAPGSVHARSGKPYVWAPHSAPPSAAQLAPASLLDLLRLPERGATVRGNGGEITPEQLSVMLGGLDARQYGAGHYDQWLRISAACHDATDGDGFAEWAEWCNSDPDYADVDDALLEYKWRSFEAGKPSGVTYLTLFKALSEAGRADLLRRFRVIDDFRDEMDAAPIEDRRPKE